MANRLEERWSEYNSRVPFIKRLHQGIRQCDIYKKPHLRLITRMYEQYANGWFSGGRGRQNQPINLIDRGISILIPYIASHDPRILVQPRTGINNPNIPPFAKTLGLAMRHLLHEIKFATYTLQPVIQDSFFGMGITKTGIWHSHDVKVGGHLHQVGQPYCDRIDIVDYIFDVSARNREEMKYEGHRYRLPANYVIESGLFKHIDQLKFDQALLGDPDVPDWVKNDGNTSFNYNELYPTVELIDIWLPDEGIIITIPNEGQGNRIMRTVEWEGPEGGPFDVLAYKFFPNSVMPIPPVYSWLDYNSTVNRIVGNMRDISEREKTVGVYDLSGADDAEVVKMARHGELIGLNNPEAVREVKFGGFDPQTLPFLQFMLAQYSQTGPNLNLLGGNAPSSPTLGQDQMLMQTAMQEVDQMQTSTYKFVESISRKLAWFLWSDPLIVLPLIREVAGEQYEVEYSESTKEGDFFDYNFEVEPYSMSRMSPEARYQRILQLVSQVIIPLLPMAAQQGANLNVTNLVKELGPYLNVNVDNWWDSIVPSMPQNGPYQPMQGQALPKNGQDQRGQLGQMGASKLSNISQQQGRAGGQSSPKQK